MNWARVGPELEKEVELCQVGIAEPFRLPWAALAAFTTLSVKRPSDLSPRCVCTPREALGQN